MNTLTLTNPTGEDTGSITFIKGAELSKAKIFNVTNSPDNKIADVIGKEIELAGIFVQEVTLQNEETGEIDILPRIVLIDVLGGSYECVSKGIFNACKNLVKVFGAAETWEKPIKIRFKMLSRETRHIFTFEVIE